MKICVSPSNLCGNITVPYSKSILHRVLIASALTREDIFVPVDYFSDDILSTLDCISVLFCNVKKVDNGVYLKKHTIPEKAEINCGSSGTTLRFFLPICASLGVECKILCSQELLKRPCDELIESLNKSGAEISKAENGYLCKGKIKAGVFSVDASVSSQYISGLMYGLSLLNGESEIISVSETVSKGYIDLSVNVLRKFGIDIYENNSRYYVNNGKFIKPKEIFIEGDWSQGAFWHCLKTKYNDINIIGLDKNSVQRDKRILEILRRHPNEIDCTDIPDIVPVLATYYAFSQYKIRFLNVSRLAYKESNRIEEIIVLLRKSGRVGEYSDGVLTVFGSETSVQNSVIFEFTDHRMIMAAVLVSYFGNCDVIIDKAENISKSYPELFNDLQSLGGIISTYKE